MLTPGIPVPLALSPEAPTTAEEWRPLPGFDGQYLVSSHGNVMSVMARGRMRPAPRPVRATLGSKFGHRHVPLCRDGVQSSHALGRLVLLTFVGAPPSPDSQAAHLNGCPADNRLENLAWVTCKENQRHRRVHGTDPSGERAPSAKLSNAQVDELRSLASALSTRELSARFGVTMGHVRKLVVGHYIKRVTGEAVEGIARPSCPRYAPEVIAEARAMVAAGASNVAVSAKLGMGTSHVSRIRHGKV